jgi:hypothetical protein
VNRKFKALGLSLFAMFALSIGGASAAHAVEWTPEKYPANVTAQSAGVAEWGMGNGSRRISCASKHTGVIDYQTKASLVVAPEYSGCISTGGLPVTIATNGCSYTWTVSSLTAGTQSIGCPEGKEVSVNVYANATKQKEGITTCEYTFGSQATLGGFSHSNKGEGTGRYVAMTMNVSIKAKSLKGSKLLCGAAAGESFWISTAGNIDAVGGDVWGPVGLRIA